MGCSELDVTQIAGALGRLEGAEQGQLEAYFERRELLELDTEPDEAGPRLWREQGFALRLLQKDRSFLASRDGLDRERFESALRQVSRRGAIRRAAGGELDFGAWPEAPDPEPIAALPDRLEQLLRHEGVGFPFRLRVQQHRRWVRVVSQQLVPDAERECFFSLDVEHPGGRRGELLGDLEPGTLAPLAASLAQQFEARRAGPLDVAETDLVLAPPAAAVMLHEAVAHGLEADVLACSGDPLKAVGHRLAPQGVSLLDDPGTAPPGVCRCTDDEGTPVLRRWLLRDGAVEQPLSTREWAARCPGLEPGAAWRGDRHEPPLPRSRHLRVPPGDAASAALGAGGGLYVPTVAGGRLDPLSGSIRLRVPWARRLDANGRQQGFVGPFVIVGSVASLLGAIVAVGSEIEVAGAGWCAKGGQKVPVWASTPALRLEQVAVVSGLSERP